MEFLNEIPTTWLVGALTAAYLAIIGAYGAIIRYFFKQRKESQRARSEMRALIGKLDTKMDAGFTEIRREIQAQNTKMDAGFTEVRKEIRDGDAALRKEIQTGDAALRRGDAALRKEIREGDAALKQAIQAGDAALREDIRTLTAAVIGETQGRPEEFPTTVERIAEAG